MATTCRHVSITSFVCVGQWLKHLSFFATDLSQATCLTLLHPCRNTLDVFPLKAGVSDDPFLAEVEKGETIYER